MKYKYLGAFHPKHEDGSFVLSDLLAEVKSLGVDSKLDKIEIVPEIENDAYDFRGQVNTYDIYEIVEEN